LTETDNIAKPKSSNIPVLYTLRAVAAISVCLFHYICTTTGFFHNPYLLTPFSFGKYGVEMFFVISGFVMPWAMYNGGYTFKKFFTFLFKRIARLEPSYIASLAIAIVLLVLRQKYIEHTAMHLNPMQVFLHFGYMIPFFKNYTWFNQVYWTLAIEFQFYIFMAFFYTLLVKGNVFIRLALYIVALVACYYSTDFLPYYISFFLLGIIVFLKKIGHINNIEFYISSTIMAAACVYKFSYAPAIFALVAFICIAFFESKEIKFLHPFGKISYSLYLLHPLLGAAVINVLSHNIHSPVMKVLLVLLGIGVTLLSSFIMYWLVEGPSMRFSGKIKYKKPAVEITV